MTQTNYLTMPIAELDAMMKTRGMFPLSEMLAGGQPMDRFMTHAGMQSPEAFRQWFARRSATDIDCASRYRYDPTGPEETDETRRTREHDLTAWYDGKSLAWADILDHVGDRLEVLTSTEARAFHDWLQDRYEASMRHRLPYDFRELPRDPDNGKDAFERIMAAGGIYHEVLLNLRAGLRMAPACGAAPPATSATAPGA